VSMHQISTPAYTVDFHFIKIINLSGLRHWWYRAIFAPSVGI
jgi:hypothetical protein